MNGSSLTGPIVVDVNQTVSIWCGAENTVKGHPQQLLGLSWQYNGTDVPLFDRGRMSTDHNVYAESFTGRAPYEHTPTWWTVLHFKRILTSSAGVYTCAARYNWISKNRSVEVQVAGVW